ncbi:hypothetical protein [Sutcliffiella rhizosphaerae]|uniref:Uncharacterized protein n=1 Tax=Sutcliffiella rhizosphaerae TaxID=2880967 RepID=A0ABM8YN05_9BACI|nr:hypothetical protein [Sutcliffiella rhizosphaerae]CAG9621261.1 hypothetical protein BACCIP111883_02033 [Sutcliffiella rhizosphaerae]
MKRKLDDNYQLEQSLKRLEYDMEYSLNRSDMVKKRILTHIRKISRRRKATGILIAVLALFILPYLWLEECPPFCQITHL